MITYKAEITINATRGRVLQLLTDPALLSTLLGHFGNFHRKDSYTYDVVLTMPVEKKVVFVQGVIRGPDYSFSRVGYSGSSTDERVRWSFAFELKEKDELTTILRTYISFDVRAGLLGRFSKLTKVIADMPKHIVEEHMKPYLMRFNPQPSAPINIQPVLLFTEEGESNSVIGKALNAARAAGTAVMTVDTGRIMGVIVFRNSKATKMKIFRGIFEDDVDNIDALLSMFTETRVRVSVFTLDVDDVIERVIDTVIAKSKWSTIGTNTK